MRRRRSIVVATASVLALGAFLMAAPSAHATFPGEDGRIAFARGRDIWSMRPNGRGQVRLTSVGRRMQASNPEWSADGRRIAYEIYSSISGRGDVWVMNADGSGPYRVTTHPAGDGNPTWSPNGRWLAFVSNRFGAPEILKIRSTPPFGRPVRLTFTDIGTDRVENLAPSWSPDGTTIAFTRSTWFSDGSPSRALIGRMRPDGRHLSFAAVVALPPDGGPIALNWAPGGARLAWLYQPGYGTPSGDQPLVGNIWRSRPDGSGAVRLTDYLWDDGPPRVVDGPSWSPDRGRWIVYSAELTPSEWDFGIFRVAAGGLTDPVLIAENGRTPDWGVRPSA